jgi:PhzF family phenazine biosynthesis protein
MANTVSAMPSPADRPSAVAYHHVDVFSAAAYAGNSVAVIVDPPPLTSEQMALMTQELRHFETVFVQTGPAAAHARARVFDLDGELDFAGHPVLGAAAVLHHATDAAAGEYRDWTIGLKARSVSVRTIRQPEGHVSAVMDAGRPQFLRTLPRAAAPSVAAALDLVAADLDDTLPLEVVSTGLRYLIVPVRQDVLARTRIRHDDFTGFLDAYGAQFAYVLDAAALEGRHWNNDGIMEDVATGSAASCVAAFLLRHGLAGDGEERSLAQGRFLGRPSRLAIAAFGSPGAVERVTVGGDVATVAAGTLLQLPATGALPRPPGPRRAASHMPNRVRRTTSTAASGPLTSTCAACGRPNR